MRNLVLTAIAALSILGFQPSIDNEGLSLGATPAYAGKKCGATIFRHDPCGPAPNTQYGGGGHNPDTIPLTFCIDGDLYKAITRRDGTVWFDFGLYYGVNEPEEVGTIKAQCKKQNVAPGTVIVVYITCPPYYVGWVYLKVSNSHSGKRVTLQRGYPFKSRSHDPMS